MREAGPPAARGALLAAASLAALVVLGGCAGPTPRRPAVTFPPETFRPVGTATPAILGTRETLRQALGTAGIQLDEVAIPRRPPESPSLVTAPRAVYRAVLPRDPDHGFIVVYDFPDPARALAAAEEQASYVGSPVGRVQFPTGTQFVVRQLGTTVVFHAAVPGGSPDPLADAVPGALRTVGAEVVVPG
jgi:hypothetical protein